MRPRRTSDAAAHQLQDSRQTRVKAPTADAHSARLVSGREQLLPPPSCDVGRATYEDRGRDDPRHVVYPRPRDHYFQPTPFAGDHVMRPVFCSCPTPYLRCASPGFPSCSPPKCEATTPDAPHPAARNLCLQPLLMPLTQASRERTPWCRDALRHYNGHRGSLRRRHPRRCATMGLRRLGSFPASRHYGGDCDRRRVRCCRRNPIIEGLDNRTIIRYSGT